MLTRRDVVAKLIKAIPAIGVAGLVLAEPPPGLGVVDHKTRDPLLFVLRLSEPISDKERYDFERVWNSIWAGQPAIPLLILPPGAVLDVILHPDWYKGEDR